MAVKRNKRVTKNKQRLAAKATRKKQTPLEKEYAKQRKRITNYIARKKRAGYEINFVIPVRPKRITKASISRLIKITPKQILKGATKKPVAPTPHYAKATDTILTSIEAILAKIDTTGMLSWQADIRQMRASIAKRVLDGAIMRDGRNMVAERLENCAIDIIAVVERMIYDSADETFRVCLAEFTEIIKGEALTQAESQEAENEGDMYDI